LDPFHGAFEINNGLKIGRHIQIVNQMKRSMKNTSSPPRTRLSKKHIITCALLTLATPLTLIAQQTVFYDTFGESTLNQTNIPGGIPGGTASDVTPFSATSYTIASAKNALATTIGPGHLVLITSATSSGNTEAQAIFTKYPVTLASVGDYIELTYTFTDKYPIFQNGSATSTALFLGLFNSGGVAPLYGTVLQNGGVYTSSQTSADLGGTKDWVGYSAQDYYGNGWRLYARPAQTTLNNLNQNLLYNYPNGLANGGAIFPAAANLTLSPGQQYTVQLRVTLSAPGQLTISNALYAGTDTSGLQFTNTSWTVTGANVITTNFDGLGIGYRAGNPAAWTNDINSIKVVASLAAQAGPYYFVTSSGDPCAGGLTIGLSGSVTTNAYLLYTNGVFTGASVQGTGSPISFGLQTVPATYTVVASNTVTGSEGPMLGSAEVLAPGISLVSEPSSVTVVTNVTASFSVGAVGASLKYQWYVNGTALTNGGNISGAQSSNLVITLPTAANAASGTNGYYCVVQTPCGDIATSSPPAALSLIPPHELVWQGTAGNLWDYTDLNFTNASGTPQAFVDGDDVTFNDSSANTTVVLTNSVIPTLVTVNAAQSYTFADGSGVNAGKISGFGKLVDTGSGTLIIANDNNYTGGTVVSNGATLQLGGGTGIHGTVQGIVDVFTNGTLNYNYAGPGNNTPVNIFNGFAGGGVVNFNDVNGSIIATDPTKVSSNFNGTINIQGYTCLHASDGNAGYALGNGSTINVPASTQVWLDRSATAYNNTFNIAGTGWQGAIPNTGALRVYGCTINGPINLMDSARIGGTINGATIQGVISGPYQLEIWGNTNSFVLVMGPTNGLPQAYASTLITAGAIRAANSNAISAGPLTLDAGGDFQVYGNNITVASLSSINSGSVLPIEGPRVRNMHPTLPGTLTVGTDNSSSEFDGTFSDGAAAALGLTKVGSGTLTLTQVSSNTGPVTVLGGTIALSGSGEFTKAPIVIASGAFLNVSGIGGTLTLNSNQYLQGNGTLSGTLSAPPGSIVNPGMPMGTLTVSGSATINGTYLANLNRTNASNCSKFTALGGATFNSATLNVTNFGPRLQVGDSFQLFPGAQTGFSTFALQTNDPANNAVYTWNNTVATDGRITVASVANIINTNVTTIMFTNSGSSLTLAWPADHIGWTLQVQTNTLAAGLGTNWVDVTGSATTNKVVIPVTTSNGSVFYRLKY
jgi:autotransporter-associated beta strand protein